MARTKLCEAIVYFRMVSKSLLAPRSDQKNAKETHADRQPLLLSIL